MKWLAVDPGETTGWCLSEGDKLIDSGQEPLWDFIDNVADSVDEMTVGVIGPFSPLGAIVCEDWSLYPWVIQSGALDFDKCRTARGIGALELIARLGGIPIYLQGADIKEAAVAAGAEEDFLTPRDENRHQNDAIMHRTFYLAKNGGPPCE